MKQGSPDIHNRILRETGFSLLADGLTIKVRADGYSMYPSLKPGAVIIIEPFIPGDEPSPGEIIAWKRDKDIVVHRVVGVLKNNEGIYYITRGDSCKNDDPPVAADRIAGKVKIFKSGSIEEIPYKPEIIVKPAYLFNRLRVSVIIKLKRLSEILRKA
jgi:signal peptidase I